MRHCRDRVVEVEKDFYDLLKLLDPENSLMQAWATDCQKREQFGLWGPEPAPPARSIILGDLRVRLEREKFDKMTRAQKDAYLLEKVQER